MADETKRKSLFDKLKRGLFMTHTEIIEKVKESLTPDLPIDRKAMEGLEEGLLGADIGAELTMALVERIGQRVRDEKITQMDRLTAVLREETRKLIPQREAGTIDIGSAKPFVILVVGVNGTGKTTTIAKLASRWKNEGKSVILGAADTFRAAAIEQLQMWADRIGVPMIKHKAGSDPGAVAHDAVSAAKSRGADV
ncbi:MAG: signal recognition particle-docking protein FtsY, partial [Acidobacteria bacterium]|nr:signal recognition particle-docking protein FtsY [Acidobacteriota bacterium]